MYFGAKNWVVNSDIKGTATKKFPFEWCRQRSIEFFFLYFPGYAHFDDDLSIDELNIQRESAHSETNSRENGGGIQNL